MGRPSPPHLRVVEGHGRGGGQSDEIGRRAYGLCMAGHAAIFDLDRTLIAGSSAPIFEKHLREAGIGSSRSIPFSDALLSFYTHFGENWFLMQPARLASRAGAGWDSVAVEAACTAAAAEILEHLQPFASSVIERHRSEGAALVLATTSPEPFVAPLAKALGFHECISTRWKLEGPLFTGQLTGPFVWGAAKADAVADWATFKGINLAKSFAYSDSYFDAPLLDLVGNPVAVNPDAQLTATALLKGWPIRHLDKSDGVAKVAGREIQDWTRPLMRPGLVAPYAKFSFNGLSNVPAEGGALMVFNHRSYFDPLTMGMLMAKVGRPVRGLGKKEVFDVPVVGRLMTAVGGVRVERGSGSDEPLDQAAEALRGGEVVMMAPEGTIPRGPAFFDPELKGRWGAARLAAMTGVPVVPVGLWGTERVWPRNSRVPNIAVFNRPKVQVNVGPAFALLTDDPKAGTAQIMSAISELLPQESRSSEPPTEEDLSRTYPPGYRGDPSAETARRPGTDTSASNA